jgi:ribosome-binding factor A
MPRRHSGDHRPNAPSQRQLRVGEVIRHSLADIFSRGDLQDPTLREARLTVSEVRVSPDMRHATVYVTRLGGGDMRDVIGALARARGYLRSQVGQALTTRNTPDLAFVEDKSFDEAEHIAKILHSEAVRHDLEKPAEDDDVPTQEG